MGTLILFLIFEGKISIFWGFSSGSDGKESACNAGNSGSIPGLGKCCCRREWLPTPVLLPGESHDRGALSMMLAVALSYRAFMILRHFILYTPFGC